jgi:hypothetical protein
MAKIYSVLAGGLLSLLALQAQPAAAQAQQLPPRRTCATEEINAQIQAELKRLNPSYNPARSTQTARSAAARIQATTYTLPVVVHVIHNGEAVGAGTNISQAQVQSQIDVLNEDYRNLNPDGNSTAVVPSAFQPLRGDVQLQFVMAQRNPNGVALTEPGIDRVNRNTRGFTLPAGGYGTAYINSTIKPATSWNPEQYINIWVMPLGGGLLGYAQFPDNTANVGGLSPQGGTAATDGVVVLYTAFGSQIKNPTGTYGTNNPYNRGRTLTHELGHFFGMRHIWGDADCGNDYVSDTPTQFEENYNCPSYPHVTCSNGASGDMFMNYMDYVNDACMAMFSKSQAARIQTIMAAGTPRRTNLLNSPAICTSVVTATVGAATFTTCAGSSVTLTATGPAGATYYWSGPNDYSSTEQNPTINNVTPSMAGTYSVIVSGASGTCPARLTTSLVVNYTPPAPVITPSITTPVCSGTSVTLASNSLAPTGTLPSTNFNSGAPAGWTIGNTGAAATTWQYTPGNTLNYSGGFTLSNFTIDGSRFAVAFSDAGGAGSVTNTTLTSPAFSTIGYSALSVSFQQVLVLDSGVGTVEISTNGGTTWTTAATYYGANTVAPSTMTINLASYLNQASVQLRWHYTDVWGYLWAIDNVAFTATPATYTYAWSLVSGNGLPATVNTPAITVTPTQNSVYRLTVSNGSCASSSVISVASVTNQIDAYPVPFGDDGLSLKVSTCTAGPATVQIYDIMGRRVYENTVGTPQVGSTTISLPETGLLRPGKYIVKVQQGIQNTTFNVVRQ